MSMSYAIAQEGIFDPEATVETLLAAVKENITSKVTSVDQAADLENRLSEEAAEFNAMLSTISNAMRQCEAGEITKEEALAAAKPCVDALKERCEALKLGDVDVKDDDITENEIAMLREYIVGCKDIVAAHKEELQDCPITQNEEKSEEASEGVLSYLDNLEVAEEASGKLTRNVRHSADAKNAAALYKNAKKLYAMGSKDKAKSYMEQAKAKYQKCLDDARKVGKEKTITRTTMQNKVYSKDLSIHKKSYRQQGVIDTDTKYKVYETEGIAHVIAYFEDRVDTCEAYLRQWANKAGNKDLKETKEMLKKERQEEKARIRAERKAAKEKAAAESALIAEELQALEAIMDGYELDLAMDAAMESEGTGDASKASGLGSKLRSAFGKLKNAFKRGDKKAAQAAGDEIKDAAAELNDAADNTDEEGKKKLSTAAKIGIAAAAAILLVTADAAVGRMLANKARDAGKTEADLKGLTKLLITSSDIIIDKVGTAGAKVVKGATSLYDKAAMGYYAGREKAVNNAANAALNRADKRETANANAINRNLDSLGKRENKGKNIEGGLARTEKREAAGNAAVDKMLTRAGEREAKGKAAIDRGLDRAVVNIKRGEKAADALQAMADNRFTTRKPKRKKAHESLTDLDGVDFLTMLAMEEANFGDDVALTEIENEEGRGFDDEAQGEDLIDEAIVGEDEFDDVDEEEADESVLESALAIFKLEDGLDPDED